jgi:hypothetical protein
MPFVATQSLATKKIHHQLVATKKGFGCIQQSSLFRWKLKPIFGHHPMIKPFRMVTKTHF